MDLETRLNSVVGFLQLEMPQDALGELTGLAEEELNSSRVQELVLAAQMMDKQWNAAVVTAQRLCRQHPRKKAYFIHAAYCLHEIGDTTAAREVLLKGPKSLIKDALFHYNMGCYSAVLGDPNAAKSYLDRAFELDESLRQLAQTDKDLVGLVL
ncbi:hypothetical protein Rhal01_03266 [Rubritalea halochordaticola]|uniref:Tetratricopeptide repeat protein n=1 Tax=Rubritalea halochordaticola TaxID=714537 RepID=A0ABP9V347_9BACT